MCRRQEQQQKILTTWRLTRRVTNIKFPSSVLILCIGRALDYRSFCNARRERAAIGNENKVEAAFACLCVCASLESVALRDNGAMGLLERVGQSLETEIKLWGGMGVERERNAREPERREGGRERASRAMGACKLKCNSNGRRRTENRMENGRDARRVRRQTST